VSGTGTIACHNPFRVAWPYSHLQSKRPRRRGKNLFATWWLNPPQSGSVVPGMGSLRGQKSIAVRNRCEPTAYAKQYIQTKTKAKQWRNQAEETPRTQWRHSVQRNTTY